MTGANAVSGFHHPLGELAGGAFSPFGDITTLMVWQKGIVQFQEFFALFIPSVVNWLVPAVILGLTVATTAPQAVDEKAELQHGTWLVVGLFILTIIMAVSAHNFLHHLWGAVH